MESILAYVRVSTNEQAQSGLSLEAQRSAILAEAERRGWTKAAIRFIEDAGYSAKNLRRPGIEEALRALKAGEADTLVVSRVDRLTRSITQKPITAIGKWEAARFRMRSLIPRTGSRAL